MTSEMGKLEQIRSTEKIFMIEVVVQKVFLDVIELNDLAFRNADTCLSYRFLDYGPFKICESDFKFKGEEGGCAGCGILKNGTSTMFPLFPEQIIEAKTKGFQLDMDVQKMFKPIPKTVGSTQVAMKQIFTAVLEHMFKKTVETVSKSMKNRYKLQDAEGDPVGYVDLFVRLSSMGKMIITKFQMDTSKECVEFHSNAGNTYKYQKLIFPDPYLCKPCGQPARNFPPHTKDEALPKDFPAFKVTEEMKKRLKSRRNKELGIPDTPEPERKSVQRKSQRKSTAKKGAKGGKKAAAAKPAAQPAKPSVQLPPANEAAAEAPPEEG